MQVVSASQFRTKISKYLSYTKKTRKPIIITTPKDTGVFISLDYWNEFQDKEEEQLRVLINEGLQSGEATQWESVQSLIEEAKLERKKV